MVEDEIIFKILLMLAGLELNSIARLQKPILALGTCRKKKLFEVQTNEKHFSTSELENVHSMC